MTHKLKIVHKEFAGLECDVRNEKLNLEKLANAARNMTFCQCVDTLLPWIRWTPTSVKEETKA